MLRRFWCQTRTTRTASGTESNAHQWATPRTTHESAQLSRAPVSSVNKVAKTRQAISRTANLIVTSRLAGMLDHVSAIESSEQSHKQPIQMACSYCPGPVANTHRTLRMRIVTHSRRRGMAYG